MTPLQLRLLTFLNNYIVREGYCPSFDEMRDGLNIISKSGVFRLVNALEREHYIARIRNRSRAIEVLRMPGTVRQPPRGTIVDAVPDGPRYVVRPSDYSMQDAGIYPGDEAIVLHTNHLASGDLAVVRPPDEADCIRRVRHRGTAGHVTVLEAANPSYETRIFAPGQVQIIGKVMGLVRRYGEHQDGR